MLSAFIFGLKVFTTEAQRRTGGQADSPPNLGGGVRQLTDGGGYEGGGGAATTI